MAQSTGLFCEKDERRDAVRGLQGWNGLDYVEVSGDGRTLYVFFLGKLPPELAENKPGIEHYLTIEGGERVTGIKIIDIDPQVEKDPEKDDHLVVYLDKTGDFSTYTLRLSSVRNIDPMYAAVSFSFKIDCPLDLDCAGPCDCPEPALEEPDLNYLAKDYSSFRQLMFDRLALTIPSWTERHAPDIGVALVEVLAYTADYLSYYQDAVATEAYLETARKRISVRRHARLVDYYLHEGCNARAYVSLELKGDFELDLAHVAFITGLNDALPVHHTVLSWYDLRETPANLYLVFEPMSKATRTIRESHNSISFYTWGRSECCLARGATSAFLLDKLVGDERTLHLEVGDVLVFEEVIGPVTGLAADANGGHRHAVRLTRVSPGEDAVIRTEEATATPIVEIEWAPEDALPFPLCLSALGPAPGCLALANVSVARGNVILVDHGRSTGPEDLGVVEERSSEADCECTGRPGEVRRTPRPLRASLSKGPLTWSQPLSGDAKSTGATAALQQDVRATTPQIQLESDPAFVWEPRYDLLASDFTARHFVVETDEAQVSHLRFGDGAIGFLPPAGMSFRASFRVGNGESGNAGAESISRIVFHERISGLEITVRNPMPAVGGTAPESTETAKLLAPHAFRKTIERAIVATDYEALAEREASVQQASAELVWTGSWYEADVAIDPLGSTTLAPELLGKVTTNLERYRRIGHDLHVERATYAPLLLELEACALPYYQRAHIRAALLDLFGNRSLGGGRKGFFHPDNLTFGESIYISKIIAAAQAVPGVECVTVKRFGRLFSPPNGELESGVLPLRHSEIAQLDNDPNHPERGSLLIHVQGER